MLWGVKKPLQIISHEILLGHQLELIQQAEGQLQNGLIDTHLAMSQLF